MKKMRVLIVFEDIITDMEANKKLSYMVTDLFLRRRKRNISRFYFTILLRSA